MFLSPPPHVNHPQEFASGASLEDFGVPLLRAWCRGGTAAWIPGSLAVPGTQGSWQPGGVGSIALLVFFLASESSAPVGVGVKAV